MNALLKAAPFFVLFMLLSPTLALAQVPCDQNCRYIWSGIFGFETSWLNEPRELIINAILPSLAIYVIFLGVFRAIKLGEFMGDLQYIIALVVTLSSLFTGMVGAANTYALALMGQYAFWMFVGLFVIGVTVWGTGYWRKSRAYGALTTSYLKSARGLDKEIDDLKKKIEEKEKDLLKPENVDKTTLISQQIERLEAKLKKKESIRNKMGSAFSRLPPESA